MREAFLSENSLANRTTPRFLARVHSEEAPQVETLHVFAIPASRWEPDHLLCNRTLEGDRDCGLLDRVLT